MILFSDTPVHDETPDPVARQSFREVLAQIVAKARGKFPESSSRIERAEKLVLAGDVQLLADGKHGRVNSQSAADKFYLVNDVCSCRDFAQAPHGLCAHRTAVFLYRKVLEAWQPPVPPPQAVTLPPQCTEAPASVNVYVMIAGRRHQITLRDGDEMNLLARMQRVLEQYPAAREETRHEHHQ